jgi:hypothetical protein
MVLFEVITLDIPYRRENWSRFEIPAKSIVCFFEFCSKSFLIVIKYYFDFIVASGIRPTLPDSLHKSLTPVIKTFTTCTTAGKKKHF